jgi:glucose repression regulatory protein TUP1
MVNTLAGPSSSGSNAPSPYSSQQPHTKTNTHTQPLQSPYPQQPSTPVSLADLDPEALPRELKKEGSDWLALFNPKVKKVLDVDLVHTLVHDSYVFHASSAIWHA